MEKIQFILPEMYGNSPKKYQEQMVLVLKQSYMRKILMFLYMKNHLKDKFHFRRLLRLKNKVNIQYIIILQI